MPDSKAVDFNNITRRLCDLHYARAAEGLYLEIGRSRCLAVAVNLFREEFLKMKIVALDFVHCAVRKRELECSDVVSVKVDLVVRHPWPSSRQQPYDGISFVQGFEFDVGRVWRRRPRRFERWKLLVQNGCERLNKRSSPPVRQPERNVPAPTDADTEVLRLLFQ